MQVCDALEGLVMVKDARPFASVDAVMNSLRNQGIAFRGPIHTPSRRAVFLVEGHIFLEAELVDLFSRNKLNREGIQELARQIEPHS